MQNSTPLSPFDATYLKCPSSQPFIIERIIFIILLLFVMPTEIQPVLPVGQLKIKKKSTAKNYNFSADLCQPKKARVFTVCMRNRHSCALHLISFPPRLPTRFRCVVRQALYTSLHVFLLSAATGISARYRVLPIP